MDANEFAVTLQLGADHRLLLDFGLPGVAELPIAEGGPQDTGDAPDPAQMLAGAVVGCLSASLLFCLRKAHIEIVDLQARVEGQKTRNENGRLRIGHLKVTLAPTVSAEQGERMTRCLGLFQDFCTVAESVRAGIAIDVVLEPHVLELSAAG